MAIAWDRNNTWKRYRLPVNYAGNSRELYIKFALAGQGGLSKATT